MTATLSAQVGEKTCKLARMIRGLDSATKEILRSELGIADKTFYRRLNDPGSFTLDEAPAIKKHLDNYYGQDFDLMAMLQ